MMTHAVLLRIRREVPKKDIERIFAELAAMKEKLSGMLSFAGGPYSSPEGLNKGFTHGFVMTFRDAAVRDAYLSHPAHEAVKGRVLEVLDGGIDGAVAFDFES
jgi:hypothetical protein